MNFLKEKFYNPTQGYLSFNQVIDELKKYLIEKPEEVYDLIVGCDSSSDREPSFPVVIVALRKGQGGRFFLKKISYKNRKFYNWKERILEEIYLSCQLALSLKEVFEKELDKFLTKFNYDFRYIHADIGENGKTKDMIKEVVGLIKSNGFEAKIKPESYAASVVADRYT